MKRQSIVDPSPGTGVFRGDLAYGRCKGEEVIKYKDFPANYDEHGNPLNLSVAPLVLVAPRDPDVWVKGKIQKKKEKKLMRKKGVNETSFQLKCLEVVSRNARWLKSNIHVKIDKSRLF